MNLLQESLYWITSGLLVPCIVFLLFMLVQCLLAIGQYLANKGTEAGAIETLEQWVISGELTKDSLPKSIDKLASYACLTKLLASRDFALNRLFVSQYESGIEKQLSRYSFFAKLGPIMGLVGTLIPMGPALKGLADGNIQALAGQMQIAFTTTVIGLIVGAIGLTLYQKHKRQAFKELAIIDFILEQQEASCEK
jgi:biopolymer transport protein ExbB/TolQ